MRFLIFSVVFILYLFVQIEGGYIDPEKPLEEIASGFSINIINIEREYKLARLGNEKVDDFEKSIDNVQKEFENNRTKARDLYRMYPAIWMEQTFQSVQTDCLFESILDTLKYLKQAAEQTKKSGNFAKELGSQSTLKRRLENITDEFRRQEMSTTYKLYQQYLYTVGVVDDANLKSVLLSTIDDRLQFYKTDPPKQFKTELAETKMNAQKDNKLIPFDLYMASEFMVCSLRETEAKLKQYYDDILHDNLPTSGASRLATTMVAIVCLLIVPFYQ